jgi:4-amino-4-deoxy-L-arabinose transferase-like glycosyltransferase
MDPDRTTRWRVEVPTAWDPDRRRASAWDRIEAAAARPLFRPSPRSAMVFPLVVLVAVLPGLVALHAWDLTPPGPLWGLRGLAVLDGLALDQLPAADAIKPVQEAAAYRMVASQPPLYAWLEAALFWLGGDRDPLASVLPSYVAGGLAVMLVYLHGRLWRGAGLGLIAAILVGFNQNLLLRMQEATPSTLALCGVLAVLLAYGWHERVNGEAMRPPPWAGPVATAIVGGLAMGLALLSLGGLALIVGPIILLHQDYLRAGQPPSPGARIRRWRSWRAWRDHPGRLNALIASAIALAVALPWFFMMVRWHGWQAIAALRVPPERLPVALAQTLPGRLVELAPVTLPLGLFGAIRAVRTALVDEVNSREAVGGALWVIWLVIAALVPAAWPHGPQSAFDLVLMVPLSLLAAQTIADLVNRRVPVRALIWLAPVTALSVAWWASADLRDAVDDVVHGRAEAATALGLHLALDLIVISVFLIRAVDRWARRRDDRQRGIIAVFLAAVLVVSAVDGVLEVVFRHGIDRDLLALRTMILRRDREKPFQVVAVLSPPGGGPAAAPASASGPATAGGSANLFNEGPSPGGRLRFILRTALPHLPQRDLSDIAELSDLPEGQRLVILAGTDQHLAGTERLRLGLEAIHPGRSGILDAYATARDRPKTTAARAGGP